MLLHDFPLYNTHISRFPFLFKFVFSIFVLTSTSHFGFPSDFCSYIFFKFLSFLCDNTSAGHGLSPSSTSYRTLSFIFVD
ncbi:hypothetical protein I3842_16G078800 [Carya illinoinensis]|uniref:Uncharacterized protein n=1 Tax=Carya illinoinensis TaxID=32201 RepID=A0A922A9Y0_CARIL|nr:hypothetical protein I3842_16G078800 [Carya illinoinensis]